MKISMKQFFFVEVYTSADNGRFSNTFQRILVNLFSSQSPNDALANSQYLSINFI